MGIDGVVVVAQYGNEKERSEEESLGVVVFIRDYFVVIVGPWSTTSGTCACI